MNDDRIERIRARAFAIWEAEGKPEGKHEEHWQRALETADSPPVSEPAPGSAAPAPAEPVAKRSARKAAPKTAAKAEKVAAAPAAKRKPRKA